MGVFVCRSIMNQAKVERIESWAHPMVKSDLKSSRDVS
jgi:hypothetical protein